MSESSLPEPSEQPEQPGAAGGTETVLCVDDEPNILSSLRRSLRPLRCRVVTAEGGAQALELLSRERIDVVISDMRMPVMNGAELLERVHQGWPGVIRILLTGHADMESTVAAINRGRIDRYLNKPWDEQELQATGQLGHDLHISMCRFHQRPASQPSMR